MFELSFGIATGWVFALSVYWVPESGIDLKFDLMLAGCLTGSLSWCLIWKNDLAFGLATAAFDFGVKRSCNWDWVFALVLGIREND